MPKAQRSAAALSDRLERYWDSIRLEVFHTRELGLSLVQEVEADRSSVSVSIQDALDSYLRLKGAGRSKTFFQGAERAVGYLTEATNADELSSLSAADAARFRDHLIGKGLPALSNPFGRTNTSYFHGWTTFYWAWWIAWSPFVGMFITRISKGRTVREFIICALVALTLVCALWMSTFGGAAIDMLNAGGAEGAAICCRPI